METLEQQFDSRVRVFLGRTSVSPTTFGMKALGDPNLMRQIDGGRSLSLRTADRVLAFVADYDLDSGGPRTPPRGHRRRKPSSRARRTRRSRAMSEQPIEQRTNPPTRFLRRPEVQARTGLSRSTIKVRMREGSFPKPLSLGARAVGWIEAEVDEWIRERYGGVRARGPRPGARGRRRARLRRVSPRPRRAQDPECRPDARENP